jgi:hypothetical protein
MPRVGFEHTIPVFEGTKTVHALDRAATVNGYYTFCFPQVLLLGRVLRGQGGVIMNCWVNTNGKETKAALSLDTRGPAAGPRWSTPVLRTFCGVCFSSEGHGVSESGFASVIRRKNMKPSVLGLLVGAAWTAAILAQGFRDIP